MEPRVLKTARNHELDTDEEEMVRGFRAILRSGASSSVKVEDVKRLFRLSPAFCGAFFEVDDETTRRKIIEAGPAATDDVRAADIAQAMASYLSSNVAMLLFSKITLYRAIGENPRVVVSARGMKLRVHIERVNGEKEHFNRDGEP